MGDNNQLLQVTDLKTYFYLQEGIVRAVDGVSLDILRGETLGVVGESGCGKSVTAQAVLRIVPHPGRVVAGDITLHRRVQQDARSSTTEQVHLTDLDPYGPEIRSIRGAEIAMVFQEPMTSLSPVHTIGDQITEVIILHQQVNKVEARERTLYMLGRVGMPKPAQTIDDYPHHLSGGMRQRAMIAMALSCTPSLLIADEPTTALDVTTQAQILDLMRELQGDLGMAIMFITHDLGVIAEMARRVVVMYLGKVVESASADALFYEPHHPYTQALLNSIPRLGVKLRKKLQVIEGSVPDPYNIPTGCPFHPRCEHFIPQRCDTEEPLWVSVAESHMARCHLYA